MLGGALVWADLPAGTSCMVKDAPVAVFSVACFTKVLETKPPSPVVKCFPVVSSEDTGHCNNINIESRGSWGSLPEGL